MDEQDLERTDLRTGQPVASPGAGDASGAPSARVGGPGRLVRAVLTGVALVVAAVFIFTQVPRPVETPAQVGAEVVALANSVPWGTLRLDGRAVTANQLLMPYTGLEPLGASLVLPPGRHSVEYVAPPFTTLRCRLSVPRETLDTCPLTAFAAGAATPDPSRRVLDLGARLTAVPPQAYEQLRQGLEATLETMASATQVDVGERYRDGSGALATATTPLSAQVRFVPVRAQVGWYRVPGSGQRCAEVCLLSTAPFALQSQGTWRLGVPVQVVWEYGSGSGSPPVASSAPQDGLAQLDVWWNGAWSVRAVPGMASNPTCATALGSLPTSMQVAASAGVRAPASATYADGCYMEWGDPRSSAAGAIFYRLGAIYPLTVTARSALPGAPIPDDAVYQRAKLFAIG